MRRNQITKFYVPKKNSYFDCISIRNGKVNLDLTLKVIKNTSECCRVNAQTRNDGTHTHTPKMSPIRILFMFHELFLRAFNPFLKFTLLVPNSINIPKHFRLRNMMSLLVKKTSPNCLFLFLKLFSLKVFKTATLPT